MTVRVSSYDLFDTLITRAVGRPTSLFLLMGRLAEVRARTGCTPEQWARTRVQAERLARHGRPEVTLDDIYREVRVGLALRADDIAALQAAELQLERRLSRPVPGAAQLLKDGEGTRRIALSDMYLPQHIVSDLLDQQGLLEALDEVLVSSFTGSTKSSGGAYLDLLEREGVRPREVSHVGDNHGADVRVPRLLGLHARHTPSASLNRYEEIWEQAAELTGGLSSLIAGASRAARLHTEAEAELRPLVDVTAGVAAPILSAYVLWVLRSAAADGIGRLYFLARDGEVLFQIAQRLNRRLGLDLDLRYLYGSRSVYHRAALADGDLRSATWAWKAMYGLTPLAVLGRLGLDPDVAAGELSRLGIQPDGGVEPDVIQRVVGDERLTDLVQERARALRERVRDYFRQEGFCDGVAYGVVDTGWAGRIVQALEDALPDDATPVGRGWFFGYMNRPDGAFRPDVLRGYLFDEVSETGVRGRFEQAYGPVETFTVADCGMTTDFRRGADGRLEPVLAADTNPVLEGWPWQLLRETLLRFVDEWVLDPDLAAVEADLRSPVAAVLDAFWSHPTPAEAHAWGRYPYEDDLLASSRNALATGLAPHDFLRKTTDRSYEGKRLWLEGSVALTAPTLRPPARAGLWFNERLRTRGRARFLVPESAAPRLRLLQLAARARRLSRGETFGARRGNWR